MKLFVTYLSASCLANPPKVEEEASPSYDKVYHQVGWQTLFNSIAESDGNAVISPLSVMGGMFMLAAGSDGDSQQEIYDVMNLGHLEDPLEVFHTVTDGLESPEGSTYTLQTANGVFVSNTADVPNLFESELDSVFNGNLHSVDFAGDSVEATNLINQWVSEQTNEKIPEIYPEPLDADTAMVLASSLYFKGNWKTKFTPRLDDEDLCWFSDEQAVREGECLEGVKYMYSEDKLSYREYKKDNGGMESLYAQVVQIPFQIDKREDIRNKLQLSIWYPSEDWNKLISEPEFDKEFQEFIMENAPTLEEKITRQPLHLTIPKFSIDFNVDLIENLRQQGIETVFSNDADFSPIVGEELGKQVYISAVDHAVRLDLDETGVEGVAVTAIRGIFRSVQMRRKLEIQRPFYFSITNKCQDVKKKGDWKCPFGNIPLFVGKVTNPITTE